MKKMLGILESIGIYFLETSNTHYAEVEEKLIFVYIEKCLWMLKFHFMKTYQRFTFPFVKRYYGSAEQIIHSFDKMKRNPASESLALIACRSW